ncbi:MAG: amidase [Herbaspirillum sp.]|nr:amidase [Herbaspirillum sp.]
MSGADDVMPGLHGAFMREGCGPRADLERTESGPLAGCRLAVKDVFDVIGLRSGAGNPSWLAEQKPAAASAVAVRVLLAAGAQWVGKTVTDELTYSLAGINAHYGTPRNPAAPERLPGGSSSGSAVAVAAGHADIALGTDCGGSIRLPASYCGIWGMRPTHGRIATNGCFTLAHSFDTVSWFARTGALLSTVFEQLAVSSVLPRPAARLLVADDTLELLDAPIRAAFEHALAGQPSVRHIPAETLPLSAWAAAFRTLQAAEIWQQHGEWIRTVRPPLGPDVAQRFEAASRIVPAQTAAAQMQRVQAAATMARVFDAGGMLVMPTVPTIAPRLDAALSEVDGIRARSMQLLCVAGMAGLPQVSFPWTTVEGAPAGLSVIGPRGSDEAVLCAALELHASLAGRCATA